MLSHLQFGRMHRIGPLWAFLSWVAISFCVAERGQAQRGPAVVEVKPIVKREQLAPVQSILGTVEPTRKAVVGSAVDGRVTEMLVREGDRVKEGEELAKLLTETIDREIEAEQAELDLRTAQLEELQNGSRPEEIAQAEARLRAAGVVADYRNRERERLRRLNESSAISLSELEDAASLALEAQERLQEAQAAYDLAVAGPRAERIAQAQADVAIRSANLQRLKEQKLKHTMFSRFAGWVTVEHTEVGQWVTRGEPVAEVTALDEVFVVLKVPEIQIPLVHVGDEVQVQVSALPGQSFTGRVAAIIPQADVRSRTFPVKVRVANTISAKDEPLLKAGMLAHAKLPIAEPKSALLVAKDALVLGGPSTIVWKIAQESIESPQQALRVADAVPVPVTTGESEGALIEVTGALDADDLIVVRGNERIPPSPPDQPPPKVTWRVASPR